MPSFTKKAIIDSFLHIAEKKSLDKITVRDIVDDCGINRNTFYYYFQDIYAVLEEICQNGIDRIPKDLPLPETMQAAFEILSGFALRHPKPMRQIAIVIGVEGSERYFGNALDKIFANSLARTANRGKVPPMLPYFLRHAFLGVFTDWLKTEKHPDTAETAKGFYDIGKMLADGYFSDKN